MIFRVAPPKEIGELIGAWTNNGPRGPRAVPPSYPLTGIGIGAALGLAVGLVAFFVVAGVLEWTGPAAADAFLGSLALGALAGAALAGLRALRPPQVLTLFVGKDGCAQIERFGSSAKVHLVPFDDVESMRTHVSVMTYRGIRTALREIHVLRRGEKEKLWFVTAAPGEQKPDDPQYHFGEAVLRAFNARSGRVEAS